MNNQCRSCKETLSNSTINIKDNMRLILISLISFVFSIYVYSQGCSDAGLCTISGLDSGFDETEMKSTFKYSTIFGLGEQNVFHISTQLEASIPTIKSQVIQVKIPYNFTFGNLGNISGLGDLSISLNQKIFSNQNTRLNLVAGIKIPSNDANKTLDGFPLPMAYQTSLGTYDMILGLSTIYKKWHFGFGYQHSFGHNLNEFEYRYDNPSDFNNYNESYHLQRADDIMLRIERQLLIGNANYMFSVLPIYHLGDDKIKNGQDVRNSSGLTLNLVAKSEFTITNDWKMGFTLAAPIIDKEVRPDGLTRSFVAVISFARHF